MQVEIFLKYMYYFQWINVSLLFKCIIKRFIQLKERFCHIVLEVKKYNETFWIKMFSKYLHLNIIFLRHCLIVLEVQKYNDTFWIDLFSRYLNTNFIFLWQILFSNIFKPLFKFIFTIYNKSVQIFRNNYCP